MLMATKYKVGDLVQLKSGGPKMTVTKPDYYIGDVGAYWFTGTKKHKADFPPEALLPVDGEAVATEQSPRAN